MGLIQTEEHDGVTEVTLNDGKANLLSRAMITALHETAVSLRGGTGGVVVTGAGRAFCAGLDLRELATMDRDALAHFLDRFEEMAVAWFSLPRPVVAAVNGSAIAGGTILALACDVRLVARIDLKMGLTEVSLGIPFPAAALELVVHNLDPSRVGRALLVGEVCGPEQAKDIGYADRLVDAPLLLEEARTLARRLGASPGRAYAHTKAGLRAATLARLAASRAHHKEAFLDALTSPAVRDTIAAQLASLKKKA